MLRSFRLANHRSFRDEHELLLMPTYDKTGRSTVPVAAIFGANASGKSSLLDGLRFMAEAVRDSQGLWDPVGGVPRRPFLLQNDAADQPSTFVVELILDSVRHTYGFVVDDERVLEEWLYAYPHGKRRLLFERTGASFRFGSTMASQPSKRAQILTTMIRPNGLFLSLGAQTGQAEFIPAYTWFAKQLQFSSPTTDSPQLVHDVADFVRAAPGRLQALGELLRAADLGLSDVRISERGVVADGLQARPDPAPRRVGSQPTSLAGPELVFVHAPEGRELTVWDESDGTLAWLRLLLPVLRALESNGTIVVDEIDASLHPELLSRLVLMFRDERTNPLGAQLIFTTHDATLLGSAFGEEILGRDEIWFVEKDRAGVSKLFALAEFHPRKGENRESRYLGGSYGAVPMISSSDLARAVELIGEGARGRAS